MDLKVDLSRAASRLGFGPSRPVSLSEIGVGIVLTAIYFLAGKLGLSLAVINESASAVWPPTGIAFVAILLSGYRAWPCIFLGAFLVNITTSGAPIVSVVIAVGNTLEAVVGVWLVNRYAGGKTVFDRPESIFKFGILAGFFSTAVAATIGVASLFAGGLAAKDALGGIWYTWWLGDLSGDFIVAPVLLLWTLSPRLEWDKNRLLDAVILLTSLIVISLVVFGVLFHSFIPNESLEFLTVPVLVLIAFLFPQRETSAAIAIFSTIAVLGTLRGMGPFYSPTRNESLILLQSFMSVNAVMGLAISAVVSEARRVQSELRRSHAELDLRVQQRTAALSKAYEDMQVEMAERKRSESKLKVRENQLQEAQRIALLGSWEWDIPTDTIRWSDELYNIFGISPDEFDPTFEGYILRIHPDDRKFSRGVIERAYRDHLPFTFEHRVLLADGRERIVQGRGKVTTDDQGKAVKMLGTAQDVTERKLAEQSLRASQESLQRIVEGSLDMIIVSNKNRKIVLFNKAAEKIFQYKRDEVLGKDTQFLFAALGEREKIHEVMMANDRFVGEILNKKKNGDIFPTFLSASVLRDEHGEVVGHMGVSRDISDQKQAEASLSASREAFSRVVEGSLDIIISVDPSRKITLFNPAAEKAFGFRADEVLGGTVQVLYADMKDYEAVSVALRTKYQFVGEVMNLRKDGTMFPSFLSASSLRDREGNVIGSMGISRDITEQKRSEAKFRGLLESAPDAMVIVDGKGEIVIVNSQVERLFGYHRDELIGKKVELLIPERFQGRHARHRSGYSHEPRGRAMGVGLDLYARRRDGSEFPVEVSLGPLETDEGMLVMSAIRDTTERRKVESALRESDERFRAMVEGVKDYALIMVDPSGKVLNWNAGAERIHGYQEEEIVGKSIYAFYLPEDRQRAKPMRGLELAEAEGRFEDECWHVRKDGSRYWANVIVTPLRSDGGALRGFSKITRDITDRKRAEKKFRDLLESAPDAMLIIDGKGSIVLVNSQTEKLFGYKRDELIGVSPETLVSGLLHLNLSRAKGSILRKTASGSSAVVELTGKKSDGSQFPVEISLSPLETDEGILVSTAIRDITSRKLAEQQAREVFKREILLKEIHHRVKNNLQIVSSMLNLQSEYFRDPRTVELLAESQNRIRSISLIHDMLYRSNDLSRVNLGEYIESLTAHLVRSFGNERSKIDLRIRAENIVLGLDTAIPCGLIINELVSNSLKYAFPDGRKGLITVDLESQDGGTYALAVRDNGVGFPAGLDFRKTTTLGLQLVGMFVEQLDGVMSMHNKQGTEFRITFKELRYEERS